MQLIDFFDKGVARYPERDLIRAGGQRWTYAQMSQLTNRIARALHRQGLGDGAHVAGYSPNHPYAFAAQYGVIRSGAVWIPINFRNSARENTEVIAWTDVDWLFFHGDFEAEVAAMRSLLPRVRGYVCIDRQTAFAPSLEAWIAAESDTTLAPDKGPHDVVTMLTTSGTTGRPKGVMLTNLVWETTIVSHQLAMPGAAPPVHVVAAPMTHAAGTYTASMLSLGVTNVLLPRPDPLLLMQAIAEHRASTVFLPPTVIYMMLAHPRVREFDFSSLKYLFYGAAPMAPDRLAEALEVFGPVLIQGYGQSEAPILTFLSPQEHAEALARPHAMGRLASAGREGPLVRLEAMDDEGRILPRGESGEIVVRSNLVMKGYYKQPEATAEVGVHSWHHTGDVGRIDADGFVYIIDRKRDLIVSGGFNVFPAEVERVAVAHPAVQECAVVGIPDDKWGEAVLAVVEIKRDAAFDDAEFLAFCRARLGGVKAPKSVARIECIPRTSTGKVLRREVRAPYWSGRPRAI